VNTILLSAERELRATGTLSEATCLAFAAADEATRRGFVASFAFLGCPTSAAPTEDGPVPPSDRIAAIRLMMLRLSAHTGVPRWSSLVLENLVEAALRPSGAAIGDVVQALFAILAESPPGLSDTQANFIREVAIHVVGKQRRAYAAEDFSWLAAVVRDPTAKISAAQAYLAAYTLPVPLTPQCLGSILQALHSTRFEEEVRRDLVE
jgi:hypothetical protein